MYFGVWIFQIAAGFLTQMCNWLPDEFLHSTHLTLPTGFLRILYLKPQEFFDCEPDEDQQAECFQQEGCFSFI